MIVCDEKEFPKARALNEFVTGQTVFYGPLRQLMALIHESDLVIDNDSGPAHLGVALNVPTIVLAGNELRGMYRDPETYQGPFYVFHKEVPCRDMLSTRCFTPAPCGNRICLDFPVEDVLDKSLELLQLREEAFRETPP